METKVKQADETDRRLEIAVANLLRTGVVLATAVVLAGAVIHLAKHWSDRPHYGIFRGEPSDLCSIRGILDDLLRFSGRGTIQFGFLLLIATPVLRVATSLAAFVWQRDRTYMLISLIVLSLLLCSLFLGVR